VAIHRALLTLMPDTCVVREPTSLSTAPSYYGITEWSTGGGSTYRCRYDSKRDQFRLADGGHITQTGKLVIDTTSTFSAESKITLSDGTEPAILSIEFPWDEDGQHHARVVFGYRQGN